MVLTLLRTRPPSTRKSAQTPRDTRNTRQSMLAWSETKGGFEGRKSETAKKRTKGGRARNIVRLGEVSPNQPENYATLQKMRNSRHTRNRDWEVQA